MNSLENAVRLELADELLLVPTEFECFEHSETYEAFINRLFDKMRGNKYHRFTKKATTIILIAAILFALVVAGFSATVSREFVVRAFSDHSEYSVVDKEGKKRVKELTLGYIPEGFTLESESGNKKTLLHKRFVNGSLCFDIDKSSISSTIGYDSKTEVENIDIDGITYVCFSDPQYDLCGLIWNKNGYIFYLQGNIEKDEILKIAQSVE